MPQKSLVLHLVKRILETPDPCLMIRSRLQPGRRSVILGWKLSLISI